MLKLKKREKERFMDVSPLCQFAPLDVSPPANIHNIADVIGVSEVLLYPYRYLKDVMLNAK